MRRACFSMAFPRSAAQAWKCENASSSAANGHIHAALLVRPAYGSALGAHDAECPEAHDTGEHLVEAHARSRATKAIPMRRSARRPGPVPDRRRVRPEAIPTRYLPAWALSLAISKRRPRFRSLASLPGTPRKDMPTGTFPAAVPARTVSSGKPVAEAM